MAGNEDNGDSLKRSHARTATLSAPNPVAGHHQPTPLPETPGHPQAIWGSLLWGHCSFLLGPGAQGSVCALQESISQSCVSSGSSMVRLMATSSKRTYVIPKSAVHRAPVPVAEKQISISKTKIDVLVTNWTGISPTYLIHNRTLFCVSP